MIASDRTEEDLRASFARHETWTPDVDGLRRGIAKRQTVRRRRRLVAGTGAVALLTVIALVAVPLLLRVGRVSSLPLPPAVQPLPDRPLNFLLIGTDQFPDSPWPDVRSDTIILVHLPADHRRAYLISFERDLYVGIPGHGPNKLSASYAFGGAELLATVVSTIAGVSIDGTVVLTTAALRDITDTLGGVNVCLNENVTSFHTRVTYPAGCGHFDGTAAGDLARQRHGVTMGAFGRDRNVQRIIFGLFQQASQLNVFTDAGRVLALLRTDGVTMNLPGIDPIALAAVVHDLDPGDVVGLTAPTGDLIDTDAGSSVLLDTYIATGPFTALRNETLSDFAAENPDWVVTH